MFIFINVYACNREPVIHPLPALVQAFTPPPKGFVEVIDIIPSIKLDIRYATNNNFTGAKLDGYESGRAFLLPKTARDLAIVQKELEKQGLSLKIYDAYRPLRAELQMLKWARDNKRYDLLVDGYLNTNIKRYHQHGHPCGNCVDITIVDAQGKELDMGTPFDHFSEDSWTVNAEGKVLENRLLLKNLMTKNGFRNFYREWWHYTHWEATGPVQDEVIR
ncbi:MAG: hypothetical protein JW904_15705 [Spirochaetales bacterium]|nr:hypothetical protein [Spirochaetales bacterium]